MVELAPHAFVCAAGPPDLDAQDAWPLLQVVLPEVQEALWATLHQLRQAMRQAQDNNLLRVRAGWLAGLLLRTGRVHCEPGSQAQQAFVGGTARHRA